MNLTLKTRPVSGIDLPAPLEGLRSLASNFYWTWQPSIQAIFAEISAEGWARKDAPVRILRDAKNLSQLAQNAEFVSRVQAAVADQAAYLASEGQAWFHRSAVNPEKLQDGPVAYFCAEYAHYEGFNQYSGGLGILAGDHCKEASDLGLPFVAVGLFYRRGFFHQVVDGSGRQEHVYKTFDPEECCCERVLDPVSGEPLTVVVPFKGRTVSAAVWLARSGRVPMILLDTDVETNSPEDRYITSQLYCNGRSMRLHQETILGVGGVKALRALGIHPSVWHLNEGHSALLLIERLREAVASGKGWAEAKAFVGKDALITIHTPVPEGNERFDAALAKQLIEPLLTGTSLQVKDILKLGLGADGDKKVFDMTAFALQLTAMANGVSLLHGRTADKTWREIAGMEVIGVTNGVHVPTWLGPDMRSLFEKQNASFAHETQLELDQATGRNEWTPVLRVAEKDLWQAHQAQKRALLQLMAERMVSQHARHGKGPDDLQAIQAMLEAEDGLLIGFARRFATYKRATLVLSHPSRAKKLFKHHQVQIVFSGKAHPADRGGQHLIEQVHKETEQFSGHVLFVEDYDMELGKALTQGVDLWLNNPRRPLEASGTSGMKAALNGVPNASILDGWWDEACEDGVNGFAIGDREEPKKVAAQDKRDAVALYECLEEKVIPLFFDRDAAGLPTKWIQVMKKSISTSIYSFSTARMIRDYWTEMYGPLA